jgi:hypothetical protein
MPNASSGKASHCHKRGSDGRKHSAYVAEEMPIPESRRSSNAH